MFGCLRYKGGFRDNPSAFHFLYGLKNYVVCNILKPGYHSNTEESNDVLIGLSKRENVLGKSKKNLQQNNNAIAMHTLDDTHAFDCDLDDTTLMNLQSLQVIDNEIMYYISGYIAKKVLSECQLCNAFLT